MADRFGADRALDASGDVVGQVREANEGRLVERVLVCTAARPALEQALGLVDDGGTILYFAPPAPGETLDFPAHDLWKRGVSIVHTYAGPPADMRTALELLSAKRVNVAPLITHRLSLAETQEGFRLTVAAGESLKVIIEPER
jgi:threonine dehydrogenase-like Zn-dependent dehydrogenase